MPWPHHHIWYISSTRNEWGISGFLRAVSLYAIWHPSGVERLYHPWWNDTLNHGFDYEFSDVIFAKIPPKIVAVLPWQNLNDFQYKQLESVHMTWKLNVDGIHDLEPTQTNDCVPGVSRSKTKNMLSLNAKLMLMKAKTYTQNVSFNIRNTKRYKSCIPPQ